MSLDGTPIVDLSEWDESRNILVYGDSGVGKTVWATSADGILILATEKGTIAAKRQGLSAKVWPCEKWEDVVAAYDWSYDQCEAGTMPFKLLSIDSITKMQEHLLRFILNDVVENNPSRDPDIPAIQDHQKWQNMFKRFVNAFCELPVDCVFTALEMRHEDDEGEDVVFPMIQGKGYGISNWVCGQMGAVGRMSVRKVEKEDQPTKTLRKITWEKEPPYFGKDRYNFSPGYKTINKTLAQVIEMIEASGNEKPPEKMKTATPTRKRRTATKTAAAASPSRRRTTRARTVSLDDEEEQ